ncbi:MAG: tetratricopeptide repeat protein [Paludibacteraceae bacterium]|nr:tetratricopeptide repeat protein [Paludibacteraceae bacterium]
MKRILLYIVGFFLSTTLISAQDYKQAFRNLQQRFEQRQPTTINHLKQYMEDYPYTTYSDEVLLMEGILHAEKGKYKPAIKAFGKVDVKNLSRESQPKLYFYWGYTLVQQKNYQQALSYLLRLKSYNSLYTPHARYYAGYCYYCTKDFPKALAEFLSVEQLTGYQKIVPYYIIQIEYAQGEYKNVYERANHLLDTFPENINNYELHRMLGEMYYQDSSYHNAISHLSHYQTLCREQKQEPLRGDIYLLGLANYHVGNYPEAIQQLKNVKEQKDSISESTYLHLGHSYLHVGDEEKAKLSYAAAIRFKINEQLREEAMYNYVQITYRHNSALGESITAFQDFLREFPNTQYASKIHALMADIYMNSKNYTAAYESLLSVNNPDDKIRETIQHLRYQVGIDAFLRGNMLESIQWMTQVIDNEEHTSNYKTEAYFVRAESQYRLSQYAACIEDLQSYEQQPNVASSTNHTTANYIMGYALFNQQLLTQAEAIFRKYIEQVDKRQNTYSDALNRIGDCLFNDRQFDAAIVMYDRVVALSTYGVDYALFQKGYALGLLHRYSDKIQALKALYTQYPRSDYADDALYETARAQLQLERYEATIDIYNDIIEQYPRSNKASKAALELGMVYRTLKQNDHAIQAFKNTIEKYAGSEEAYAALENLEQVYVETNNITDYLAYTKTLHKINMQTATQEDSLVFVTAELQYIMGNYEQASAGLTTYLTSFCPQGRYCVTALYYAANSFYQLRQYDSAIEQYSALAEIDGNPHMEDACTHVAELTFDKGEYNTSRYYFQRLLQYASSSSNRITALLGMLRCSQQENDITNVINVATQLLEQESLTEAAKQEVLYYRAKAYINNQEYRLAVVDLTPIAKEVRTEIGAEAKYLLANAYFQMKAIDMAEKEIMSFTQMQTSQQYWLAKSLILLADINIQRNDTFQAKQYLLALQANYRLQDNIQNIISEKLIAIEDMDTSEEVEINEIEEDTL